MKNWLAKFKENLILWLILLIVGTIYFMPYYRIGLPQTHDGENHVARFAQYYLALKQGQLIPRIGPALENGFGYPVFNFNYPLANIASLPLSIIKVNFESEFKIIIVIAFLLGGVSLWFWLKKLIPQQSKPLIPLLAFLSAPYLMSAIFYRGSIGEVLIFVLTPLVLWQIENIRNQAKYGQIGFILALAAFFLAHNVMVLFLTPLIIVYAIWRLEKSDFWRKFAKSFFLAIGLTLWFWLPALFEKSLIVLDNATINLEYSQHYIDLSKLFQFNFTAGLSNIGFVDGLSLGLGLILLLTFGLSIWLLIYRKKSFYNYRAALFLLIINLFFVFLQTSASNFIWKNIPLINYIQFPWRINLILNLTLILSLALIKLKNKKQEIFFIIIFLLQMILLVRSWPNDFFHKVQEEYLNYSLSTSTLNENRAKTFTFESFSYSGLDEPEIIIGNGQTTSITRWDNTKKVYNLSCVDQCLVVENTAYFPGYETKVNNLKVNYQNNDKIGGRIAYQVGPGDWQVTTKLTQKTWPRLIANTISISTLIYLIISVIRLVIKNKK